MIMMRKVVDCTTQTVEEVPFTPNEIAQYQKDQDELVANEKARIAAVSALEAQKLAIVTKLGITYDELKILLS